MNTEGHTASLVASHPGNRNAVKHGVFSPRHIESRAAEIEQELVGSLELSPVCKFGIREVARNMAVLESIDAHLSEEGLLDKRGKPSYLLECRTRVSRCLASWLEKITPELERAQAQATAVDRQDVTDEAWHEVFRLFINAYKNDGLILYYPELNAKLEAALVAKRWTPPAAVPSQTIVGTEVLLDGAIADEDSADKADEVDASAALEAKPTSHDETAPAEEGLPRDDAKPELDFGGAAQLPPDTVVARVPEDGRDRLVQ